MIPQGTTLYAISEEDGSTTVYLVVGWTPSGYPLVIPLHVPSQTHLVELIGKAYRFVTELP